jgi:hypothetical protein
MANINPQNLEDNPGSAPAATPAAPDPFDLDNLVVDQNYIQAAGVKKLLTTIPIRKPHPQDYVRVHPDPNYRKSLALIEIHDDRETYLVPKTMAAELSGESITAMLYTATNRQGVLFFWPVRLPGEDGKILEWHRSLAEAAERAMPTWVRVKANMSLGAYEIYEARAENLSEPEWPDLAYQELLRIAFRKEGIISGLDHPVVKKLRGLI